MLCGSNPCRCGIVEHWNAQHIFTNWSVGHPQLGSALELPVTKPTKLSVHPAKTQISLGICPVWSESLLSAWRNIGSSATHWAHCDDSDETGQMPRPIWVFAVRTDHFVGLSWGGLFGKNNVHYNAKSMLPYICAHKFESGLDILKSLKMVLAASRLALRLKG